MPTTKNTEQPNNYQSSHWTLPVFTFFLCGFAGGIMMLVSSKNGNTDLWTIGVLLLCVAAVAIGYGVQYDMRLHQLHYEDRRDLSAIKRTRVRLSQQATQARAPQIEMSDEVGSTKVIHSYQTPHVKVTEEKPQELPRPVYDQPDLATIVENLPHNHLAFTYGLNEDTGRLDFTTLPQAVHIQLLGASGQGKSMQSTSILTQLCASNDQNHLQLALIDCEGETTAPFQKLPQVRYLAEDEQMAARVLRSLIKQLQWRDQMKIKIPVIMIFVEEFLNLRRTMAATIKEQALEDYTTLALRGRKRGMFLFSVGQTAYSEKSIRDAQNQFQSSMAFACKIPMARSAGFTNTELLNVLWKEKRAGQFLLERQKGDSLFLAPYVDPRQVPSLLPVTTSRTLPEDEPGSGAQPPAAPAEIDMATLALVREKVANEASQNEIIDECFKGIRNADAIKLYRKYMAFIAKGVSQ